MGTWVAWSKTTNQSWGICYSKTGKSALLNTGQKTALLFLHHHAALTTKLSQGPSSCIEGQGPNVQWKVLLYPNLGFWAPSTFFITFKKRLRPSPQTPGIKSSKKEGFSLVHPRTVATENSFWMHLSLRTAVSPQQARGTAGHSSKCPPVEPGQLRVVICQERASDLAHTAQRTGPAPFTKHKQNKAFIWVKAVITR